MKIKHLCFILLFPLFVYCKEGVKTQENETGKPATIKVLLEKDSEGILLEARGPFVVNNPENGKKLSSGRRGKRFYLYPHEEGIKWGENFLGIFQLQVAPTSSETTFLINGVQYRGAIEVYYVEGKISVINEVDVESYVKATLSEKGLRGLSPNVVDAIAIIARTDAYYKALLNHGAFWHVTATDVNYHGSGLTLQNLEIDKGVDNTRYLIMTYEGQPFPCSWTENSGGKTASYSSIFRKSASTPRGVESPFASKSRQETHWSLNIDTQELAKVVKTNRVTGIDLFVDHFSGRVYAARLHDGTHKEDIEFSTLQKALGQEKLRSNDFSVSIKGNTAVFEGYGKGAGVGLCLYSASQMAERGDEAPSILSEFFPDALVEKMRSYPEAIISNHKSSFVSPKQKQATKKKYKLLH
ncbi:MAG: hypothetical protein KDK76_07485 [Chlamydiia bacterium]|nr:hypothetical protein [Chlamydiia bacterium]